MEEIGQKALIALGSNENSNLGDVRETIQKAMSLLADLSVGPMRCSALYQTPAFPPGAGADYINAAVAITTGESPASLLDHLHRVEAAAGRERRTRWGARTLDLDLIGMGDVILPDDVTHAAWRALSLAEQKTRTPDQLILPHPRVQDRAFVLIPLAEVAADWCHPALGLTVAQMAAALPPDMRADVRRLDEQEASHGLANQGQRD